MPYDPNIPADHADLTGVMFRGQFQGLKELIDSVSGVTSAVVDSVTTLPPGSQAVVAVSVAGTELHLSFSLPQGTVGATGDQGPAGEVSQSDLGNAITGVLSQTSSNTNGVSTLGLAVSDPPSQGEMQLIANKLDELISALRR
jgi:hypothetical protein